MHKIITPKISREISFSFASQRFFLAGDSSPKPFKNERVLVGRGKKIFVLNETLKRKEFKMRANPPFTFSGLNHALCGVCYASFISWLILILLFIYLIILLEKILFPFRIKSKFKHFFFILKTF